jgi:DNA invertase Pin-like site-specific DNA recombinase
VDRFSRRLSDLLDLLTELDQAGFASATEPFDTSTSIGRMLVQLLGVFAEFERETIIDRVTAGMNAKAAKGKWPGGRLPYGYQRDPATNKLVPDPAQAPVVRDIFGLYTRDRLGTRAIAAELNARGLRTRPGKPWSGHVIPSGWKDVRGANHGAPGTRSGRLALRLAPRRVHPAGVNRSRGRIGFTEVGAMRLPSQWEMRLPSL